MLEYFEESETFIVRVEDGGESKYFRNRRCLVRDDFCAKPFSSKEYARAAFLKSEFSARAFEIIKIK
jgi:hypothetical protein